MIDKRQRFLNSREKLAKQDPANILGSVEALADQVKDAWEQAQKVKFKSRQTIQNVVVTGMGGSGLGPDVVKQLFKEQFEIPFEVVNSYNLPGYVDKNSLVLLSSYSGNTEEVLSCSQQAQDKKAQIMAITSGGKLAELTQKQGWPTYIINPKYNPSDQPRMAIGYAIVGAIALLNLAGVIKLTDTQVNEVVTAIIKMDSQCRVEVPDQDNLAKTLAYACLNRRPIIVASEFLAGAAHVATNQLNENAKIFADYKVIPEINHHLMEGLKFPDSNEQTHLFLFLKSDLYFERNQHRLALTQEAINKQDLETLAIVMEEESKLTQVFEAITLFAYTAFYLAMLEGINPAKIPFVDWFKQELNK